MSGRWALEFSLSEVHLGSAIRVSQIKQCPGSEWLAHSAKPVLVEVYRTPEDPARHKETAHYQTWRDTAAEMMAEPRSSVKYSNVFPDEMGWE